METSSVLRQTVAAFLKIEPEALTSELDLRHRLRNSVARGGLDAAIRRRLHMTCADVYTVQTYGQLEAAILGNPIPDGKREGLTSPGDTNGIAKHVTNGAVALADQATGVDCGVDAESPENLPIESDYWESDFYRSHFTPREIAYCVAQENPRQNFAARWCAKEALIKCDPTYREVAMNRLEIVADRGGKPHLSLLTGDESSVLPVSVSLTHTSHLALAFVVKLQGIVTAEPKGTLVAQQESAFPTGDPHSAAPPSFGTRTEYQDSIPDAQVSHDAGTTVFGLIAADLREKSNWCYQRTDWKGLVKVLFTDGTAAMILYRLMQWARRWRLVPLEMIFNKANGVCCSCIIGRGAEFGPGFVLVHSQGVVLNGKLRGGSRIFIEHQVTIGSDHDGRNPTLGSDLYIGAGAKIIGPVTLGDGSQVGANAVVVHDVPAGATVFGIPARVIGRRDRPVRHGPVPI